LTPENLKKLAHGVEYGRDLVVVGLVEKLLKITGIARRRPRTDGGDALRIAAPRPGVLVLEGRNRQLASRYDAGKEETPDVDVLFKEGPVVNALDACGAVKKGPLSKSTSVDSWTIHQVLLNARRTRCGALFLFLPRGQEIQGEFKWKFANPEQLRQMSETKNLAFVRSLLTSSQRDSDDSSSLEYRETMLEQEMLSHDIHALIEQLGRLSANDGAVVIAPDFRFIGSGYIIDENNKDESNKCMAMTSCSTPDASRTTEPPQSGGARHKAGYRFAWSHPGAVVFIVSADGPVTCAIRQEDRLLTWPVMLPET
jgi:hypothetical protein